MLETNSNHTRAAAAPRELAGLTAVVTGSSSGIGQAVAIELAAAGAHVLVHGRANLAGAEATAIRVRELGGESCVILADLAESAACHEFVNQAWGWRGSVHLWLNIAGADVLTGSAAHESFEEKLLRLWQVDVLATVCLARAAGERMRAQSERPICPAILNLGWDQAAQGMAGPSGEMFATAKGAVAAFSRSLAHSLAPHVRVNCLAPGWIRTAWGQQASAYWHARATRESLLGRWGEPADVARAARFLVSPAAEFINGQVLPVNGGFRHAP